MSEFFRTVMGARFFEGTMPGLVRQLERLNANIEAKIRREGTRPGQIGQPEIDVSCQDCGSRVRVSILGPSRRLLNHWVSFCPRCGAQQIDIESERT